MTSRHFGARRWALCALALTMAAGVQAASATANRSTAQRGTLSLSAPAELAISGQDGTGVRLTWRRSAGNVGVVAYDLYAGPTLVRSVTGTTATVTDLVPGLRYTFSVRARDAVGKVSPPSAAASVDFGHVRPSDFTVYAFSQSDVQLEDPQVYELDPDINIRAIQKWSTSGDEAADYNFGQIERYHAKGIPFTGGGTASVIFPGDFATTAIFDDMSTRDADNAPVPHDEFGFPVPARRGNMFNPKYRQYILSWARIQIDGGVDGVFLDEVNACRPTTGTSRTGAARSPATSRSPSSSTGRTT